MIFKFGHSCFTTQEACFPAIAAQQEAYTKHVFFVVPQSPVPDGFRERVLALEEAVYLMVDMMYYSDAVQLFEGTNVSLGQI